MEWGKMNNITELKYLGLNSLCTVAKLSVNVLDKVHEYICMVIYKVIEIQLFLLSCICLATDHSILAEGTGNEGVSWWVFVFNKVHKAA